MKIALVAGARPNFMKIAPLMKAIEKHNTFSNASLIESDRKAGESGG